MRAFRKTLMTVPLVAGALTSCVTRSPALTVFDPSNYQQNLLAAARALEQINNQVRQLQTQALMLLRMDQNLVRLGGTIAPDLQRTLADMQRQLSAGDAIALNLRARSRAQRRLASLRTALRCNRQHRSRSHRCCTGLTLPARRPEPLTHSPRWVALQPRNEGGRVAVEADEPWLLLEGTPRVGNLPPARRVGS